MNKGIKMIKISNIICLLILTMILSCSYSTGKRYGAKLPPEGTVEQAQEIIQRIILNGFIDNFTKKFPRFNPQKQTINFNFQKIVSTNEKQSGVYIFFLIQYTEEPGEIDEMVDFGGEILKQSIENYYKKSPNKILTTGLTADLLKTLARFQQAG